MLMQITYFEPNELLKTAESEMAQILNDELFSKSKYQKLTEQHAAAIFGVAYVKYVRKCQVGLNETSYQMDADFFVKAERREWPFQLTECDDPDRHRGDEMKGFANGSIKTVPYEPERGRIEGPDWIRNIIGKKTKKNYANDINLLVYFNFPSHEIEYGIIKNATLEFKDRFASIWILSNSHVCSLFSCPELGEIVRWEKLSTQKY